jgi:hypothetical protein
MFKVMAWWRKRSKTAVAMTRSPKTSPQLPKLWLLVRIMGPRSYRRLISWKNRLAPARSMGR